MDNATCPVGGCEKPLAKRGRWCSGHQNRFYKFGDVMEDVPLRAIGQTGCKVEGCPSAHYGRGFCSKHLYRVRTNGDPLVVRSRTRPGEENPNWRGDEISYAGVHRRLKYTRGKASELQCIACTNVAHDWAYQHDAPDERICVKAGRPFTTDLSHYKPMCRSCHNKFDTMNGWAHPKSWGTGVSQHKGNGRWRAYANFDGRQHSAGYHSTRDEAVMAASLLRAKFLDQYEAKRGPAA